MKKVPLVGIVIVNWNKKEMTGECLKSLEKTSYKNYKVILIDNGSTDGSITYLKKINKEITIIRLKENLGYTCGTNIGWKYAIEKLKADYICAMDNDIVTIQTKWLNLIIKELEKSDEYGIGSGKHIYKDGALQPPFINSDLKDSHQKDKGQYNFIKEVDGFGGPCIIIKRSTIEKIGYYDENFFYGPNDIDYCLRARKEGIKIIYNGFSKSIHIGSGTGKVKNDKIFGKQVEGGMIYLLRHAKISETSSLILKNFIRSFITRIDTRNKIKINNLIFYNTFLKRMFYFIIGIISSIMKYKKIDNNTVLNYNLNLLK